MRHIRTLFILTLVIAVMIGCNKPQEQKAQTAVDYEPQRINKCIELFENGQPVYYKWVNGGYEEGLELAQTWADYLVYDMEHKALDFYRLCEFMRGLVEGGPTPSGHRTPAVIVNLPVLGLTEDIFLGGSWMVQQALAQGVHGVHLCKARDPEAVKRFVQAARYPIHKNGIEVVGEGIRGWGSHKYPAWVWGVEEEEYLKIADPWPLNPDGELMLGMKLEDQIALANAETSLKVPGITFAEHGPRDMGLSYGYLEGRADPPVPKEVEAAGERVLKLCKENGIFFLDNVLPDNVKQRIDKGVMIGAGSNQEAAEVGRKYTNRKMPW
ncbi:MAG: aldolase/citrate lyase family protein [bacterium]|nr:aldolase/citrate lyase family protein [bacterium]